MLIIPRLFCLFMIAVAWSSGVLSAATSEWTTTAAMVTARTYHSSTLLPSGKILVVGGLGAGPSWAYQASCELYDPSTGSWSATGSMSTPRSMHTATLLPSGKVLVTGGQIANSIWTASCELYDPATGAWSSTTAIPGGTRYGHTATALPAGRVLVVGGTGSSGYLENCQLYNPTTGTWSAAGSLATARYSHRAAMLPTGKVLVTAGYGNSGYLASCEMYDPITNTWSSTGALATARVQFAMTLLTTGKVLVAGGSISGGVELASCELYDPSTGVWGFTGSLAATRRYHASALLPSGKVLVTGGSASQAGEIYDPTLGTWSATGNLATKRTDHTMTLLPSGKVLVMGGYYGVVFASSEMFEVSGGTWGATGSLTTARYMHTSTLLSSGKVLVMGGYSNGSPLSSSEIYDPNTGIWNETGTLLTARYQFTSTVLPSGKVLVTGGGGSGGNMLSSCEIFDPSSGTWSAVGSMAAARTGHAATLLPSGKVLVSSGYGASGGFEATSEIFDPSTGTWSSTGNLSAGRQYHTSTLLLSGKVLVSGGYNFNPMASSELYDPASGTWAVVGSMMASRNNHTATLISSGKVLVTGGYAPNASLGSCEIFDPSTNAWSATGSLVTARYGHTSTVLMSGKVLVTSGFGNSGFVTASEIYDPSTGAWSGAGALYEGRQFHTSTLLPSGKILVMGGYGVGGSYPSSSELFDPGLGFNPSSQPTITACPSSLTTGASLTVSGTLLTGVSEASSGGTNSSPTNYPLVQIQSATNEQQQWLAYDPLASFSSTTVTTKPVTGMPAGPAWLRVFVNGIPSEAKAIVLTQDPITPTITWSTPPAITYGTALSALQLNASTGVAGTFAYAPSAGALLNAGSQTLNVAFTPTDTVAYTTVSKTVTLTVNKAQLTVVAQNQGRTYGAANPLLTSTITGYLNGDNASVISGSALLTTGAMATSPVATYPITANVTGMSAMNYSFIGVNGLLSVNQAALTVTAADASRAYGSGNPAFTGTLSGVVAGDTISATYVSSATTTTAVGVYGPSTAEAIVPTLVDPNARLGNYVVTSTKGALTITAATQVINNFAAFTPHTYGDGPITITGVTGGMSGQPVVFTSNNSAVATVSDATVTIVGAGTAVITATQDGDTSYEAAVAVAQTLVVAKSALNVTASNATRVYGALNPLFTGTLTGVVAGDTITATYASSATAITPAGVYGPSTAEAITPTLMDSGSRLGNYNVTTTKGTLTITPATNDVFANAQVLSPVYGGTVVSNNLGATKQTGEPKHAGQTGGGSLWWTWTAPAEGTLVVDTIGSGFDTVLAAYTGTAVNALTVVKSNDNISSTVLQSKITVTTVTGTTYRIAVDRKTALGGNIALTWSFVETNNTFAGARLVIGESGSSSASNRNGTRDTTYTAATDTGGDPGINGRGIGRSFWWKWVAPRDGTLYVSTEGSLAEIGGSLDTVLAVTKGAALSSLKVQASDDDTPLGEVHAEVGVKVVAGTTYYFCVDASIAAPSPDGIYTVTWSMQPLIPQ